MNSQSDDEATLGKATMSTADTTVRGRYTKC